MYPTNKAQLNVVNEGNMKCRPSSSSQRTQPGATRSPCRKTSRKGGTPQTMQPPREEEKVKPQPRRPRARQAPSPNTTRGAHQQQHNQGVGGRARHRSPFQTNARVYESLGRGGRPGGRGPAKPYTERYNPRFSFFSGDELHFQSGQAPYRDGSGSSPRVPNGGLRVNIALMPEHLTKEGLALLRSKFRLLADNHTRRFTPASIVSDINAADDDDMVLPSGADALDQTYQPRENGGGYQKHPIPSHSLSEGQVPGPAATPLASVFLGAPGTTPADPPTDVVMPARKKGGRRGAASSSKKDQITQHKKRKGKKAKTTANLEPSARTPITDESEGINKGQALTAETDGSCEARSQASEAAATTTVGIPGAPPEISRGATPAPTEARGPLSVPHRLSMIKQLQRLSARGSSAVAQSSTPVPAPGVPHASTLPSPASPQWYYVPLDSSAPIFEPIAPLRRGWRTASTATTVSDPSSSGSNNSLTIWRCSGPG